MNYVTVSDSSFRQYGRIITHIDFSEILNSISTFDIPTEVLYAATHPLLEDNTIKSVIEKEFYGGLPAQIGYCLGKNDTLNAVEYHKGSELNIVATDLIMCFGHIRDVTDDFTYDTSLMEAFFIPAGTAVELYATTLHYAPFHTNPDGFAMATALPEKTNTTLEYELSDADENKLLLQHNKWLIAHPEAEISGAYVGLIGENLKAPNLSV